MLVANPQTSIAQKLAASHLSLCACMDTLKSPNQDVSALKPKLLMFTDCLLKHLQVQNEGFYRTLDENYRRENPESQKAMFFKSGMKALQVDVFTFMEEYLEKPGNKRRLASDLNALIRAVQERVDQERAYMIPYCHK